MKLPHHHSERRQQTMSEKIVQFNEEIIKGQIKELVRGSVEETLNGLLEEEAEKLTQAARYERSEERQGYRSGHYSRNLTTTSGDVKLNVPRLKGISFETAIIERYRRRESSVEEALIEMYLAGVSVRRVEDITEALWGSKVSPSTISELNKKAYVHIEDWRNRPLQGGRYPYVYVDGIYLRRNWGGEYENVAILVAIAVNEDGYREVLGAAEGMKEDKASWVSFFQWLKERGLDGVKLIVGDKCMGMLEAVGRSVSGCQVPALCCPFLPECFFCCAQVQGQAGGQDAQGNPRSGEQKGCS
uniref:Mutator family transposase n=1 Tax=Clostridium sp. enrichment culture clone 7-14 TaxID=598552 RepID=C0KTA9_9CLOT|nr:transposase [Clostridium sp. enrichment culture clone 7-14]